MKLTVELVPSTSWGNNLRKEANLSKNEWDALRKASYKKAGYKCEICGGKGNKHPVECHEIWEYDDSSKTQTLKGLISLCPPCHKVKHLGFAFSQGGEVFTKSVDHLISVNGLSPQEALDYVLSVFEQHTIRSQYDWHLDLSWLETQK